MKFRPGGIESTRIQKLFANDVFLHLTIFEVYTNTGVILIVHSGILEANRFNQNIGVALLLNLIKSETAPIVFEKSN